ncbi:MAG: helix-turn-helix domain-containing protein [Hyphomicrobiaceae bacterium]
MTVQSPIARQQFARRLREFRVARGFKTARSLAQALDIDENRYTRYERAEVEPDIKLIQQICETLELSPNDLLGTPHGARHASSIRPSADLTATGFAEPEPSSMISPVGDDRLLRDRTAWSLACAVADLQSRAANDASESTSRLATLRQAARLFADLERRPYAAVTDILLLPAIARAPAQEAHRIETLIEALTHAVD